MEMSIDNQIALPAEREGVSDEALLALGKSLNEKRISALRDRVDPCVVEINHQVSIRGKFVIHEDYEQTQVNKACPWTFLQVAWNKMNAATRNACVQEVQQMLRDKVKPDLTELKEVTKTAVQAVKSKVKQPSRGQCKFNGTIWVTG